MIMVNIWQQLDKNDEVAPKKQVWNFKTKANLDC